MAEPQALADAQQQRLKHTWIEDLVALVTGVGIVSLGLFFLKEGALVTGGTAGLALLVSYASGWPVSLVFPLVNLPFFALAIWKKGWRFTVRTVLCVIAVGLLADFHPQFLPTTDLNPFYAAIVGNILAGVGLLILFRHRSSLGGINILALILQERAGLRAGYVQMAFDVIIVLSALFIADFKIVLISALGAVVLNLVLAFNHKPGRYAGF